MHSLYLHARQHLAHLAESHGLTFEVDHGGGWAEARRPDGRGAHMVQLACPQSLLVLDGLGRFHLDLAEESQVWRPVVSAYLLQGRDEDAGLSVERRASSLIVRADSGGRKWSLEGSRVPEDNSEDELGSGFLAWLSSEVSQWPKIQMYTVPVANRVLLADDMGASLAFDFFGERLAQWSIDPVADPKFELDVVANRREVRALVSAFCSTSWSMVEVLGAFKAPRIVTTLYPNVGKPVRVSTASPIDCECRSSTDYPWVVWRLPQPDCIVKSQ